MRSNFFSNGCRIGRMNCFIPPFQERTLRFFTAVRSNLSLPSCQGALEEGIDRCLFCYTITLSLAEILIVKKWISLQLCQYMSPYFSIREQSKCRCKGCENPVQIVNRVPVPLNNPSVSHVRVPPFSPVPE